MPLTRGMSLGPYEIAELIGKGGMGEVYRARDRRLDRDVALKIIADASDPSARRRFEREAKAVAALSHPNIVAIYDFSNEGDRWFAVTELLDGKTLRDRLAFGPLTIEEARTLAKDVASGLAAAHDRGIVHRDLKPENIFLTATGAVKILDFGLAVIRRREINDEATDVMVTREAGIAGTIAYMSPEQLRGEALNPASDVFSFGTVLYECLAGRRPFAGSNAVETMAAILTAPPDAVSTSSDLQATIAKCLQKDASRRFASARELCDALNERSKPIQQEPATRAIVLPFRMLRADADLEFLSYSLPDAIVGSLANLSSLIVRSSLAASHYAGGALDLLRIASEQDVNAIVSGTILTSGGRIRVAAQLTEMPSAAAKWSHTIETSVDDIFGIQDELTRKIVGSLSGGINDSDSRALRRDVPRSAAAYEFFLRANQQAHAPAGWLVARDLYRRAVEEDPDFAPAWARLGRVLWIIAKYTEHPADDAAAAERALQRALELNPDLSLAHRYYAEFGMEREQTTEAMQRLLERIRMRPNDSDLFAALGKVLRYAGLLQESLRAFHRVHDLDRHMATSLVHTYFMLGQYQRANDSIHKDIFYMAPLTLAMLGREEDALNSLRKTLQENRDRQFGAYHETLLRTLSGDHDAAVRAIDTVVAQNHDPEARYYMARSYAKIGELEKALELLEQVVRSYFPVTAFEQDAWLDPLRRDARFSSILAAARVRNEHAADVYRMMER